MILFTAEDTTNGNLLEGRLLQEFGRSTAYLTPGKIAELWAEHSKHDVLFTDFTEGKFEVFFDILMNSRAVWVEMYDTFEEKPVGVMMATSIIPNFDADVHFAVWDSKGRGREVLAENMIVWLWKRYNLHRLSAKIIPFMRGTIRFAERLGFKEEGEMREAAIRDGKWFNMKMFGLIIHEKFQED